MMHMEIHISRKSANNLSFLRAQQLLADRLGFDLIIDNPAVNLKPYDCVIWQDENNDCVHGEFASKRDALKWAKVQLTKYPSAIADLKRWNKNGDDYEDWQFRLIDGKFVQVEGFEE